MSGRNPQVAEILSPREWEVLQEFAEGWTLHEVASHLYISPETVRTHRKNILARMNVPKIVAAVHRAHLMGWFTTPQPDESSDPSQPSDVAYGHVPLR